MEKPTVKELKEALTVLGPHVRDRLNAAVGLQQEVASLERVRDALSVAHRVAAEDSTGKEKALADNERLTKENADLERTAKQLRSDTAKAKELWREAQEQLGATRQELADLQGEIEAAKAIIARGQEAQRILASLASH
jgi:hypothetical protein